MLFFSRIYEVLTSAGSLHKALENFVFKVASTPSQTKFLPRIPLTISARGCGDCVERAGSAGRLHGWGNSVPFLTYCHRLLTACGEARLTSHAVARRRQCLSMAKIQFSFDLCILCARICTAAPSQPQNFTSHPHFNLNSEILSN